VRYQYGNLLRFSVSWCSRNKVTLDLLEREAVLGEIGILRIVICFERWKVAETYFATERTDAFYSLFIN